MVGTSAGLDHVVVGRVVLTFGPGGVAVGVAVDDVRAYCDEVLVGEPRPPQRSRTDVGHDHVATRCDAHQRLATVGLLVVQADAALVAHQVEGDA
jgi:hypothetical protein